MFKRQPIEGKLKAEGPLPSLHFQPMGPGATSPSAYTGGQETSLGLSCTFGIIRSLYTSDNPDMVEAHFCELLRWLCIGDGVKIIETFINQRDTLRGGLKITMDNPSLLSDLIVSNGLLGFGLNHLKPMNSRAWKTSQLMSSKGGFLAWSAYFQC